MKPGQLYQIIILCLFISSFLYCNQVEEQKNPDEKIIVEARLTDEWKDQKLINTGLESSMEMKYLPAKNILFKEDWNSVKAKVVDGKATWVIYSPEPIKAMVVPGLLKMISPGDSIYINYEAKIPVYSGRGYEKIDIWSKIKETSKNFEHARKISSRLNSVNDYLYWDQFTSDRLNLQLSILDSSAGKISPAVYDYFKTEIVNQAELERINAFESLIGAYRKNRLGGASLADLATIFDSTQYRKWGKWLRSKEGYSPSMYVISEFNIWEVRRKFGFEFKQDSLRSREAQAYLYFSNAKQNYVGALRQNLLTYIILEEVLYKFDVGNSARERILKEYYDEPGYPELKLMVKNKEKKIRK